MRTILDSMEILFNSTVCIANLREDIIAHIGINNYSNIMKTVLRLQYFYSLV